MKEAMRGRGLAVPLVGLAQVEGGELHEVSSGAGVSSGDAVELVEVQQPHLGELPFHLVGTREVDAVGVVGFRLRWQQGAAEGGLPGVHCSSLTSRGAVRVRAARRRDLPIARPPEHPPVEGLYPQGAVRHAGGRLASRARPMPVAVGNTVGRDGIPVCLRSAPCVPRRGPNSRCRAGVLPRQTAFRSRSVTGRKVPFSLSGRQRNSVAPVSTLKRNSYRLARKLLRADSRLAAFRSVPACGAAVRGVPAAFSAFRFRSTALRHDVQFF